MFLEKKTEKTVLSNVFFLWLLNATHLKIIVSVKLQIYESNNADQHSKILYKQNELISGNNFWKLLFPLSSQLQRNTIHRYLHDRTFRSAES